MDYLDYKCFITLLTLTQEIKQNRQQKYKKNILRKCKSTLDTNPKQQLSQILATGWQQQEAKSLEMSKKEKLVLGAAVAVSVGGFIYTRR